MKKQRYKNLIYFQNGSIGDFLMTIFFLENIHLNDNSLVLNVVVPKNFYFLQQFLEKYPYINLVLANRKSLKGLRGILKLTKFAFSKNLIITAPTAGKLSLYIKIIAKKISLFGRGELVGFEDGQKINKFIYTKLLKYNTKIIYSDFLKTVIRELGFEVKKETLFIDYTEDCGVLKEFGIEENNYIVLHTQGSTISRSLNKTEISSLIKFIQSINISVKIILTGGPEDKKFLDEFTLLFKNVLVCSNLRFIELCNLIDKSKLFIGIDTGTTHLASFLQKKSLVIAHPITASNWLPFYNLNATILYTIKNCQHNIHCGREYLEKYCKGILMCFEHTALDIVENKLKDLL